jgi:hypothetical protein
MACCGLFSARISDLIRKLLKRYSYAEAGWQSDEEVQAVRVRRPLSPRKSRGRIPSIPFMSTVPGQEPTHVETIHGRSTPPDCMERSRWYGE